MKKQTYILPKITMELFHMEAMMLPTSPTDGSSDPNQAPKKGREEVF